MSQAEEISLRATPPNIEWPTENGRQLCINTLKAKTILLEDGERELVTNIAEQLVQHEDHRSFFVAGFVLYDMMHEQLAASA